MSTNLSYDFSRAWGQSVVKGSIRQQPEDFRVQETLSFELTGQGDHVYLLIEKTSVNTDWVAAQLVRLSNLKPVDVGFAGLKDRHAVTQQWFSLHMPNQIEPDWDNLPDSIRVLSKTRHTKKLKTGAIRQNNFQLCIRNTQIDVNSLDSRLQKIREQGVPNYFGTQRFGRNNSNVQQFLHLTSQKKRMRRQQRGILISAARSYLFNHILSLRVIDKSWNQMISGDVLMLDGNRSIFSPETLDEAIQARLAALEIHPASILWGSGRQMVDGKSAEIVQKVVSAYPDITEALGSVGASLGHRAMRINVRNLDWKLEDDQLKVSFSLISGAYATSVLSEFLEIIE